jgi:hypothetical protein
MASTAQMTPDETEAKFWDCPFTRDIHDSPIDANFHLRKVQSLNTPQADMVRVGVQYESFATSETEVERLLGERKDVQGMHAVNFKTQTLDSRLFLRDEIRE